MSVIRSAIARVALDLPVDHLFDYLAPDAVESDAGRRVLVPFGRGRRIGVLIELAASSEQPAETLKPLVSIDRDGPALPPDLVDLARFAADYYHHPLGAVLASLLPPLLRKAGRTIRPCMPVAYALSEAGVEPLRRLNPRARSQRDLAERLSAGPLATHTLSTRERSLLRDWFKRGWVISSRIESPATAAAPGLPILTPEQGHAVEVLRGAGAGYGAWLLFGVTGSGKTEVYLRRIDDVLTTGGQVLVLVPEIHLTPQLGERLSQRFPSARLVSLHSGLAQGERRSAWLETLAGRADIVLGTRLAVFAPMPRVGLIVVDEEHDGAYKQLEGMRYSARDVAVWRARQRDVPIIMGTATPSLESWKNARGGRYRLLELPRRAHAEALLPEVRLVDTRTDRPKQGLTGTLLSALRTRVERGEQSLVFINRRGYAPTLLCNACGHVFPCSRCSAHMVLHRAAQGYRLTCHHCGLTTRPPEACPECGNLDLRPSGQGTQRVEESLTVNFPDARILRIDRDTTGRKGAFAAMREQVVARDVDILVGTQLVAKGHDFPHLTLVGVIGADQALLSPDYRAGERLFAQLMQVAGRAGRAEHPGEVLIQTGYPRHPLYLSLMRHDYPGYAAQALKERRAAEFPPFVAQAILRAEGRDEDAVLVFLHSAREAGLGLARGVTLFDPVPALMSRVANRHRAQLLLQSPARARLQAFLRAWTPLLPASPAKGVRWSLDVDPLD